MYLRANYRNRAIGLLGALAVLILGVWATGAITSTVEASHTEAVHAVTQPAAAPAGRAARRADDCASALQCRCDVVC